jgi:transposase
MTGSEEELVMKAFPMEYRQRVIELSAKGWTTREIQQALGVSRAWVDSIKRLQKNGKSLAIKSSANHRTSLAERHGERIKARVAAHPGTTLTQLKADLGLSESIWTIWQALRALGLSLKKSHFRRPNGNGRTLNSSGRNGPSSGPGSIRIGSSSSTKRSAPRR